MFAFCCSMLRQSVSLVVLLTLLAVVSLEERLEDS